MNAPPTSARATSARATSAAATDLALNSALAALGALAMVAGVLIGPSGLALSDAVAGLFGLGEEAAILIARDIRLPRSAAAFVVGAALGLSGATLQGLLRNPLADPGVLGVSATAALGAVTAIYFGLAARWAWSVPAFAVVFALIATALLAGLAARARVTATTLILVGVGLSSLAGALTALAMNLAPNPFSLSDLVNWLLGTVANRSFADLLAAAPILIAGAVLCLASARGLSALTLGEEAASGVGLNLGRARALAIVGASLLTAGAVALAGAVGFVGVVAAHVVRPLAGHDPARVLVPAALLGGAILAMADLAVRLLPFTQELKLGVAAALFGAPAFILVAARTRGATS